MKLQRRGALHLLGTARPLRPVDAEVRGLRANHLTIHVQSVSAFPGCVAVSQGLFRLRHCGRWSRGRSNVRFLQVSHPSVVPRVPGAEEADAGWSSLAHVRPLFLFSAPTASPRKVMRTSVRGEKTPVMLRERHGRELDSLTSRPPLHTMRDICRRLRDSWGRASSFLVQITPPLVRDQNVLLHRMLLQCKKKQER